MTEYARVAPSEEETKNPAEVTELPLEDDGTLLLSTVCATFANAIGLKYRHESGSLRGLRLANERFSPPAEGWDYVTLFCVYAKDMKRKGAALEDEVAGKRVDTKCCDLIVLGLAYGATEQQLSEYFSQYGTLALCLIKRDTTGDKSKGFAFIRFNEYSAQQKVLSQRHMICSKWCDVKIPNSRLEKEGIEPPKMQFRIYVGRCTKELTEDVLRRYFGQFGVVTEIYIPNPFKACAFVTFQEARVAKSLIDEEHVIEGVVVHTSTADQIVRKNNAIQQYPPQNPQFNQYQPWGGRSNQPSFGAQPRMQEGMNRGMSGGAAFGPNRGQGSFYKSSGMQGSPNSNYSGYSGEDSNAIANLPPAMFSAIASAVISEVKNRGILATGAGGGSSPLGYGNESRSKNASWSHGSNTYPREGPDDYPGATGRDSMRGGGGGRSFNY